MSRHEREQAGRARGGATHELHPDLIAELRSGMSQGQPGAPAAEDWRVQPLEPDRFRWRYPDWWRCLRRGPVSGRYEGAMVAPNAGSFELNLRVDIDSRDPNSPVMDRVSGDIYQVYQFKWAGRSYRWRVYRRSWIVNNPHVVWERCRVRVTGAVTYWKGGQPATDLELVIPWGSFAPAGPARASLVADDGTTQEYDCPRRSETFREVTLEVDVAQSVSTSLRLPTYNTHAHNTRPSGIDERDLTVERAYEEAGIAISVRPTTTEIDDSASEFDRWSVGELHDAMETHFSQFPGGWPKWQLWGLLCGSFDTLSTAGIMFDYRGGDEAPERQGFAVFRDHWWFDDLPSGTPASQAEAFALRQYLYTWVHEAGHAFNYMHSWDKGRPNALSWMNYPQNVTDFWDDFEFRFDDEELIHLRHGDRASVILGGDPWASGGHFESEPEMGIVEGDAPLELLIRSKGRFAFMEEVRVELRLRNLTDDMDVPIDTRFDPRYGAVAVQIIRPDGRLVRFEPVACEVGEAELHTLQPARAKRGLDRYSKEVSLNFDAAGHVFDTPGEYRLRAVYRGLGEVLIPSAVHRLRVGTPLTREEESLAQDYFSYAAGFCMALDGSRSEHLRGGRHALETIAERCADSLVGARVAMKLAQGLARPFFSVEPSRRKLEKRAGADPDGALKLTDAALKVVREADEKALNISYNELVRQRAGLLVGKNKKAQAKRELEAMRKTLGNRGVNQPVLDDIAEYEKSL